MHRKSKGSFGRFLFLSLSLITFLASLGMIWLGATLFRSQLPFFQLLDGNPSAATALGPAPAPFPGVTDLSVPATTRLIMILGSDYRPQAGYRTDVIMLMAMDTITGKISLVSFPRDLWVTIPGYYEQRLNTVMQVGGIQLLANTFQTNFGIYPTEYVMLDMDGFLRVIDVLDGIEFDTEFYTADACDSSLDPDRWCEEGPGRVRLDSARALWYVRARYNSSDFDRLRRTQEVVQAVMDKAFSPVGLIKAPALMAVYESEVESNVNPSEILSLARVAMGFDSNSNVRRYIIGPNEATGILTADGANVLIPNIPAIQSILTSALRFE